MLIRPGIELANVTDPGCEREENEDYYAYAEPQADEEFHRKGRLAVVADGMGGYEGGRVASGIAVEVVRDTYLAEPAAEPHDALIAAFHNAHAAIQEQARNDPHLSSMGTTCTAAVVRDHQLYYGHVGDSRLYMLRDGAISRVTRDHSHVGGLVEEGRLTLEEAAVHPERNVLTAALGMSGSVEADFSEQPIALMSGDILLICTDGLHGLVSDEEMLSVASTAAPSEACRKLVEMAKQRGGPDNITLQILKITE